MAKIRDKQTKSKRGGGRASQAPPETLANTSEVGESVNTLTSYDLFELCIQRAKNLVKLHQAAHGRQAKPEKYMADAHRAAIVLAIAALDAFVRTFIISRTRRLLVSRTAAIPPSLSAHIKKFLSDDDLLDAARKDDLLDRVEKAFRNDFDRRSFQGTRNIEECMKMVGFDDIFHEVAIRAKLNEDTLRSDLDRYTSRRHTIAHRGDYDLNENPPKEIAVTKKDAQDCIRCATAIAKHIRDLEGVE